jgi:hypothetical protein
MDSVVGLALNLCHLLQSSDSALVENPGRGRGRGRGRGGRTRGQGGARGKGKGKQAAVNVSTRRGRGTTPRNVSGRLQAADLQRIAHLQEQRKDRLKVHSKIV